MKVLFDVFVRNLEHFLNVNVNIVSKITVVLNSVGYIKKKRSVNMDVIWKRMCFI